MLSRYSCNVVMVISLTKLSTLQTKPVFHFGVHLDGKRSLLSRDCSNLALNINPGYFWNTGVLRNSRLFFSSFFFSLFFSLFFSFFFSFSLSSSSSSSSSS